MGVGKSWITSAYVLWRLYRDPDYKALVVVGFQGAVGRVHHVYEAPHQ